MMAPLRTRAGPQAHIGLNAQLLSMEKSYRSAGISGYIIHLLQGISRIDSDFRYTVFTAEGRWMPPAKMNALWTGWPTQYPPGRIAWEQLVQPLLLSVKGVDLLHSLAYVTPAAWMGPKVVTILDLSFFLFPERFRPLNRWYLSHFTRLSARGAARVITISENTRRDVMRVLGLDAGKIEVIYCGVGDAFQPLPAKTGETFRRSHQLPERFILFVGTLEPRKNVIGLLEAYAQLRKRWPSDAHTLPSLVIGGAPGWYYDHITRHAESLDLGRHVVFAGYIPAEELPFWYNLAELFVYPSLYEGFGLPVLEAMACGTPVITSNRSSLPEVVGEAGILTDPEDTEALAEAMFALLNDADRRENLRELGLQRAAGFSWDQAARDTIGVYSHVLGTGAD